MIKLLLWDIDGTLLDFKAAEKAAIKNCFGIFGIGECTDEMVSVYSEINRRHWEALERNEITKKQVLTGRFREFFSLYGVDTSLAEAFNEEYQIRLGDTIVFFPFAKETVESLRGKVIQCAVTNGTKRAQTRKLENSGLGELFDYIFISEDLGAEKPNREFFDRLLLQTGEYPKDEIMIVGDSLTGDMRGGNNAGIKTCFFNPYGVTDRRGAHSDYEIKSISEVPALLGIE